MKKRAISLLLAITLAISAFIACEKVEDPTTVDSTANSGIAHEDSTDYIWSPEVVVPILLNGTSVAVDNSGVTASGRKITITAEGTYSISGSLTDGQIIVNSESTGTIRLILNGASITNSSSSAIYIAKGKKVIVILADNTENTLADGSSYVALGVDDEPNAAIFSMSDLTIYGNGSLTVKGNHLDGISGKDGLIIFGGTINVTSVDDGIRGKDYLIVKDGNITVKAGGDGLKADNVTDTDKGYITIYKGTFNITAGDDGMHAENAIEIDNGKITIAKSYEGIESPFITVNDGTVSITASDDGFNATHGYGGEANDGSGLTINGGNIYVNASGGDGLDSNGNIAITAGTVVVHGPQSQPEVGMDYNGTCKVSGGLLVISGTNSNMTQATSTSSSLYCIKAITSGSIAAGTIFHIADSDGNDIVTFKPVRKYSSIVFSSAGLKNGGSYTVYTGGTTTGTDNHGLFTGGAYSGGTLKKTLSITGKVTSLSF